MNALIYNQDSRLTIRKPNGLEWDYDNVDKPDLGFDYEVLIYEDIEVKILKWEDGKCFDDQEKEPISDSEKDAIELYIDNAEPPLGYNLNTQFINRLESVVIDYTNATAQQYGMYDLNYANIAGREGSNHPRRADARRTLEYFDAIWSVFETVANEIQQTREDTLKPLDDYLAAFPDPMVTPDSRTG
jgi:hypothetical protein